MSVGAEGGAPTNYGGSGQNSPHSQPVCPCPNESELLSIIIRLSRHQGPANLPSLVRTLLSRGGHKDLDPKLYRRAYHRIRRLIKKLEAQGLLVVAKENGLTTILPSPSAILQHKLNSAPTVDLRFADAKLKLNGGGRIHPARARAREIIKKKKRLSETDWEELSNLFSQYKEDVNHKVIVLKHKRIPNEFLFLKYQHRFTKSRLKRKLAQYNAIWNNASRKYSKAVFLTLTLDPKTFNNLEEAKTRLSKSFNRLMSYLRKKYGFRPPYLAVKEPQKSGNPHVHVIIFGISRLGDHYELTKVFERLGFGKIHYEYALTRQSNSKDGWNWVRARPNGAKANPVAYLRKYLMKTFQAELSTSAQNEDYEAQSTFYIPVNRISFFFATNMRFFTYSRSLYPSIPAIKLPSQWIYVGTFYEEYLLEFTAFANAYLTQILDKPPPLAS